MKGLAREDYDPNYKRLPEPDDLALAQAMLTRMAHIAPKLKNFKSVVKHSIPNEYFRILLRPTWVHRDFQKYGLGCDKK